MQNGLITPLTQWHKAQKPRSGAKAEALKSRDAQYDAEEYRHGVIESGEQAWHWREILQLLTTLLRSVKERQTQSWPELVLKVTERPNKWQLSYVEGTIYSKFRCSIMLLTTKEKGKYKNIMLENMYKWPQVAPGERKKKLEISVSFSSWMIHETDCFWHYPL